MYEHQRVPIFHYGQGTFQYTFKTNLHLCNTTLSIHPLIPHHHTLLISACVDANGVGKPTDIIIYQPTLSIHPLILYHHTPLIPACVDANGVGKPIALQDIRRQLGYFEHTVSVSAPTPPSQISPVKSSPPSQMTQSNRMSKYLERIREGSGVQTVVSSNESSEGVSIEGVSTEGVSMPARGSVLTDFDASKGVTMVITITIPYHIITITIHCIVSLLSSVNRPTHLPNHNNHQQQHNL